MIVGRWLNATGLILWVLTSCASVSAETVADLSRADSRVQYLLKRPLDRTRPLPTVIVLHGTQRPHIGARQVLDRGILDWYASQGYLAVAVSLPGYGATNGPDDFAGPYTQHAVSTVITKLIADGLADPGRIVLYGGSLGAIAAALVGGRDARIAGLVLVSGDYDLPRFLAAHLKSIDARRLVGSIPRRAGEEQAALRERSAIYLTSAIKAKTLICNGAKDTVTDPAQAREFAKAINTHGGHAVVRIFADAGHEIPYYELGLVTDAFIKATLNPETRQPVSHTK